MKLDFGSNEKSKKFEVDLGEKKYHIVAYPPNVDIVIDMMTAAEEESSVKYLEAVKRYFDECVEVEGFPKKMVKEELRKGLERRGKFIDFIQSIMDELGKSEEPKGS